MTAPKTCTEWWVEYNWQIGQRYSNFKAQVGFDTQNLCVPSVVRFLGNHGESLPFSVNGKSKLVKGMGIPSTAVNAVSMNVTGQSQLAVQLSFSACGAKISIVDVVNDQLS
ncbi:MAG TPA: hypothetical protein VED59_06465 [Acidimicrobiales bacterium]|nr:hypothetical protein [Acidimicrobiales bacterium]